MPEQENRQLESFGHPEIHLTITQEEQIKRRVIQTMRKRLELTKPQPDAYKDGDDRAAVLITKTLAWARAVVPLIALLAAIASAIRTIQTVSEIYTASGSSRFAVIIAAVAFTVAAEGALFTLALAQEAQRIKHIAEGRPRHVASLAGVARALLVRLGLKQPLDYDEMPPRDSLGSVIVIAFLFTVASNAFVGLRPLVNRIGATSLQDFLGSVINAQADLQLLFVTDLAAVVFPPLMALAAGHLTARFAAEIAEQSQTHHLQFERDLAAWRAMWADPLDSAEGDDLLNTAFQNKLASIAKKKGITLTQTQEANAVPVPVEPVLAGANGHHNENGNGHK